MPLERALLTPVISSLFEELNVGASLHTSATSTTFEEWYVLHSGPSVISFEVQHSAADQRWPYNERMLRQAHRRGAPIVGERGGFSDVFVPLGKSDNGAENTLVVGPFSASAPSSGSLLANWTKMTGTHGRSGDPAFARYVSIVLGMLHLAPPELEAFKKLLDHFRELTDPSADTARLSGEVQALRARLARTRSAERMWDAARSMLDDRTARGWVSTDRTQELMRLGVRKVPDWVLVGLVLGRGEQVDALEDLLERDRFQRACVELARARGGVIVGRLGDHGVALLLEDAARTNIKSAEIAEKVRQLARRFGFRIHFGVSARGTLAPTSDPYRAALAAAEEALSRGLSLLTASAKRSHDASPLRALRRQLGQTVEQSPSLLSPRFQRYFETASAHAGYRLDPIRAHLEAGFDELADALLSSGVLDEKSFAELSGTVDSDAVEAETVSELGEVYRRVVSDIEQALLKPAEARRDRSFRRALSYIRDHLGEPLNRAKVARVAGFAEHYFSKRFVESEGVTFQDYVRNLRIDRAKLMLAATTLSVEHVGQLCGFPTRAQFHRSFKQLLRVTPSEFREKNR